MGDFVAIERGEGFVASDDSALVIELDFGSDPDAGEEFEGEAVFADDFGGEASSVALTIHADHSPVFGDDVEVFANVGFCGLIWRFRGLAIAVRAVADAPALARGGRGNLQFASGGI